jgi:predicted GIY-YIG superfamily endonuclease
MICVYILQSEDDVHFYTGVTDNLRARLKNIMKAVCRTLPNTGLGD